MVIVFILLSRNDRKFFHIAKCSPHSEASDHWAVDLLRGLPAGFGENFGLPQTCAPQDRCMRSAGIHLRRMPQWLTQLQRPRCEHGGQPSGLWPLAPSGQPAPWRVFRDLHRAPSRGCHRPQSRRGGMPAQRISWSASVATAGCSYRTAPSSNSPATSFPSSPASPTASRVLAKRG